MASVISYEYLDSIKSVADGLATLGADGKIPVGQLPSSAIETYKGAYDTSVLLIADYPAGAIGDYAYVTATTSYWYWNNALTTPAWVDQEVTAAEYNALTAAAKVAIPYIIVA